VVNFAFHKKELEYIDEIKRIVKNIFGKETSQRTRGNVTELRVCSAKIANFLLTHGGKYAKEKELSEEILSLPFDKQFEMVKTYINGDGNIYKRREKDSETLRIDTCSQKLAIQIQEILVRGGIFSSIKQFNRSGGVIDGRKIKSTIAFNISFKLSRKHNFFHETKGYFLVPIRRLVRKHYSGNVFNLDVKNGNSYLAKGFAVHNCAAAIATSSMITELAKGKTLDDAEKITNKDVSESLRGLPPIKMHCSNLAADVLKIAIKNYKNK
jgi:intein/homing endonuclease